MEIDAAQYASISLEMLQRNSFLQITDGGKDYLDKPPLLFWLSAISIKLLGANSIAFKLPSFLFSALSWLALYRIVERFYGKGMARISVLIYLSTISTLIILNDIRTDTLLIAFVLISIWQILAFFEEKKWKNFLWAAVFLSFAMLSKGPIGLMVPILAIVPHYILKNKYAAILDWRLILLPFIILIILTPMLYGLYEQFGWHGIRFYFWEQSFGRITGENVWQNDASYFFFVHTFAWAIIPWTLPLLIGLFLTRKSTEYLSIFGFILPFIALSFSHYKLPHYIYIVVPFASIIIAKTMFAIWQNRQSWFSRTFMIVQSFLLISLFLASLLILFYVFPIGFKGVILSVVFLTLLITIFIILKKNATYNLFVASVLVFSWVAFVLNIFAYPSLLKYQSQSEVAFFMNKHHIPQSNFYVYDTWGRTLNYYTERTPPHFHESLFSSHDSLYIFLKEPALSQFENKYKVTVLESFPHINVTRLSLNFLNPKTRNKHYENRILIKIKPQQ